MWNFTTEQQTPAVETPLTDRHHVREARDLVNEALDHMRDAGIDTWDAWQVINDLERARNRFVKLERGL